MPLTTATGCTTGCGNYFLTFFNKVNYIPRCRRQFKLPKPLSSTKSKPIFGFIDVQKMNDAEIFIFTILQ